MYLIESRREAGALGENPAVIKTIVTTELAGTICAANGVHIEDTLTGFKYIGEKVGEWEKDGSYEFLFGFEESYGYLSGYFVRDKDAIIAATLIAEMALYHKLQGSSLSDAMDMIHEKYGFSEETLISNTLTGQDGAERIGAIMSGLRNDYPDILSSEDIAAVSDYLLSKEVRSGDGEERPLSLPKSNVLKLRFTDGSWMAFRPSGTEPKIKVYIGATGETREKTHNRLTELTGAAGRIISTRE
jgi:phosphoglucomutase